MQIHTDKLAPHDLYENLPNGLYLDVATRGSRSRARRFDVAISADIGSDSHGIKRAYARNTGQFGGQSDIGERAATYIEWGDWMVALFQIDPGARIGPYESPSDFVAKTTQYAPHRQARENAVEHAARWARELNAAPPVS